MKILESVCLTLRSLDAPFALIGGRAVALRGFPRTTFDYDFLTSDRRVLQRDTWAALERAGVVIDCRRGAFDDPVAGVARLTFPDAGRADVLLARWRWELAVIERAESLLVEGLEVPVPRSSDLILLKLAAGGGIDLQDAQVLLGIGNREELIAEVEQKLDELDDDAKAAWERVKTESARTR
jgi:hypothetical protein